MNLNLGCGQHFADRRTWVNVDTHEVCDHDECVDQRPDVLADCRLLPFPAGHFDNVYAGHLLEHLPLDDVLAALREMRRVLHAGGQLCIVGPDYDRAVADFPEMVEIIWPGQPGAYDGAGHQWCPTEANTLAFVRRVFPDARAVPIADLDEFWPAVSFLGWQFAVVA